nr:bifunctional diguanylate cyclase/phosphodiesterase [Bacillus sp. B15-48]
MNVVLTDKNGKILYGNQNIYDLTLYKPAELLGRTPRIFNAGYHSKEFFQELWETILSGEIWRGELKNRRKDGSIIWVRMIITPLLDKNSKPFQFLALKEDITEKKEIEFRLAQKDKQLSALTNNSYDIVGITDKDGKVFYLNPAFERVLGYEPYETVDSNMMNYFVVDDEYFWEKMLHHLLEHPHESVRCQLKCQHKDGSVRWCDAAFTNYLDDPHIHGIVFNLRDYTQQKEATDIIHHLANYDYLTSLPNRRHFENQLREAIKVIDATKGQLALLFLDLDGFKNINDTLGHEVGDRLLQEVGHRISSIFHNKAFVGRLGGDEFAIILRNFENKEQLIEIVDSLVQSFQPAFTVGDYELNVSTSIGISLYPTAGRNLKALLKNADIAMYQAKQQGKNQYQLYHPSMEKNRFKLFLLKNDLNQALEKEQFFMVYQPRIEPNSTKIVGAEALIRWSHPELGFVSHLEFIQFAEESGFIIPLGEWILKNVFTQVQDWQRQGLPKIKVSVNISVMQLMHLNFIKSVKKILKETGLDPKWIEFEIPEKVLFHKKDQVIKSLAGIKDLGITLALDNFGTGYSFLNYVSKHNFDVIKLDRSIIDDIQTSEVSYEVVMSIIQLAQKLNKHIVAGGIETASQQELVTKMGFNESQGFYFSKPIDTKRFEKLLMQENEA